MAENLAEIFEDSGSESDFSGSVARMICPKMKMEIF